MSQQIRQIAKEHARSQIGDDNVIRYLQSWWSNHYNRPLKDPILLSYTFEELTYEYYIKMERDKFNAESIEADNDKIEEKKWDEAESWADEEERKEREEYERREKQKEKASAVDPTPTAQTDGDDSYDPSKDQEALDWMEKHMEEAKEEFGDDFGEDLSLDLD